MLPHHVDEGVAAQPSHEHFIEAALLQQSLGQQDEGPQLRQGVHLPAQVTNSRCTIGGTNRDVHRYADAASRQLRKLSLDDGHLFAQDLVRSAYIESTL